MKLIFCPKCLDVKKLQPKMTYCQCRRSYGRYLDNWLDAEINEVAIPLVIDDSSLAFVLRNGKPTKERGERFEAFVISRDADTIKEIK